MLPGVVALIGEMFAAGEIPKLWLRLGTLSPNPCEGHCPSTPQLTHKRPLSAEALRVCLKGK